jgi:hypothetical protein
VAAVLSFNVQGASGLAREATVHRGRLGDGGYGAENTVDDISNDNNREIQTINPIYYLHVPKAGSSFATTLVHHACDDVIPENVAVQEPGEFMENWNATCNRSRFMRFATGHEPLHVSDDEELKHVVVMVRRPQQRVLSGYYHDLHDCWNMRWKYNCRGADDDVSDRFRCDGDIETIDGRFKRDPATISPVEYATCVENCTANMLTGRFCGDPGPADVDQAVKLIDKLGFVGLTDEWTLSVCLWHRKFGGRIVPAEFMNLRPGVVSASKAGDVKYDEEALLGKWRPSADLAVFNASVRRFWREIEWYGVTMDTCKRMMTTLWKHTSEKIGLDQAKTSVLTVGEHKSMKRKRFKIINPIYFLHVPRSGSFATTVAHHTCGADIPETLLVREPRDFLQTWSSKCNRSRFWSFTRGHGPLTVSDTADLSHVVVMIRHPVQRILSGYYNNLPECPSYRRKHRCVEVAADRWKCNGDRDMGNSTFIRDAIAMSPVEYGRCVENCTANLLNGKQCASAGATDIDRAVDTVERLGFIGITHEWALSVCLWHRKFGGRALPIELANSRPGIIINTSGNESHYDAESMLGRWRPKADMRVFAACVRRFWREIKHYGLTREGCGEELNPKAVLIETQNDDNLADEKSQEQLNLTSQVETAETTTIVKEISPIKYFRVPRGGPSFATTIAHHTCRTDIPDDVIVEEPKTFFETWQSACNKSRFDNFSSGIKPLTFDNERDFERVVMMVRDPSQRILSGYFNGLHDCWSLRHQLRCQTSASTREIVCDGDIRTSDGIYTRNPHKLNPSEYGRCVENCTANMIMGKGCGDIGEVDVDRAVDRILNFGFVGLTNQWSLSVCLWHKKFGGRMMPAEFKTDIGDSGDDTYDRTLLGSWKPHGDVRIFQAAAKRFWSELDQYGITRASCDREVRALVGDLPLVQSPQDV